ncbi:helix-turn-helix domain-containing protein [Paenibacillus sp.]|uniref:helix-turn-helix domain-containing protein n=1 Tax=Paenibacillus sp. TaxID=58172 RepID=UPI002D47232F|nr:helix-turn-helix domain-containing protein [Paenibacillus sp.]HZG85429.1 helix-turn-helix domain-containing protein [Paenibacillus sp.]
MFEDEHFQYICKLLHESFDLPVMYADAAGETTAQAAGAVPVGPLFSDPQDLMRALVANRRDVPVPVIHTTNFLENFVLVPVRRDGRDAGTLAIGPSAYAHWTEDTVAGVLYDNNVPSKHQDGWRSYLTQLPVVPKLRLLRLGLLAHYLLHRATLDFTDVLEYNHTYEPRLLMTESVELDVASRREEGRFHMDPAKERIMIGHIRNGNKTALLEMLNSFSEEEAGVLSKRSRLRSQKNLSYCAITLATRAAMEGGLDAETAYSLSDLYIQHIEELRESKHVELALHDAMLEFAERVAASRRRNVSRAVAACLNYISNHLYEPLTLEKLAAAAGLHANYLSQLFKMETGMPISLYIQKERVEEAKKLLALTDEPISRICARLGFADQTYFTKVFKRHAGATPKQYRDGHGVAPAGDASFRQPEL